MKLSPRETAERMEPSRLGGSGGLLWRFEAVKFGVGSRGICEACVITEDREEARLDGG